MAFGDVIGTAFTGAGNSVTATNATISGSATVAVGDLVYVFFAQQTALTATAANDNLGNTYTALTSLLSGTACSGKAFYTIVTNAGTISATSITVSATASSANWSIVAGAFRGPFTATPLDANPTPISTDITSPFTTGLTGTLSQADELILAWISKTDNIAIVATSPMTLVVSNPSQTVLYAGLAKKVVAATTSTSADFTSASNPGACVLGITSFEKGTIAALPVGEVAVGFPLTPPVSGLWRSLRTWTTPYNLNLYRAVPPFSQDYWPLPIAPVYVNDLRTWISSPPRIFAPVITYMPGSVFDWGIVADIREPRTWIAVNLIQPPAPQDQPMPSIVVDWGLDFITSFRPSDIQRNISVLAAPLVSNPFKQNEWPLLRDHAQPLRGWTWNYNQNLIGKDKLPAGEIVTDLPPRPPQQPTLIFTASYNKNLIAQDKLPAGAEVTDLPPREPLRASDLRTWANVTSRALLSAPVIKPFVQYDWPLNFGPRQPAQSFTGSYNANLIGKDSLPFRQRDWALPAQPYRQAITWTQTRFFGVPVAPQEFMPGLVFDWGTPRSVERDISLLTWISPVIELEFQFRAPLFAFRQTPVPFSPWAPLRNIALLAPSVAAPFKQTNWPLPQRAEQPVSIFTVSYNKNLIGQDKLPTGAEITDLPPQPALSAIQLRTWINTTALALITAPLPKPFAQYDWPLNFGPLQPIQIFAASYNKNLIGQDKLPIGEIVSDLPPRQAQQPTQVTTDKYNPNLIGKDKLPNGAEVTELPPQPVLSASQLRTWIQSVNVALISVPPLRPFNQYDWPINTGPQQSVQVFTASYNRNLIGKDQLPAGEAITDLPATQRLALQTWISAVNLALTKTVALPFNQTDWPLPVISPVAAKTFTGSYNLNLIGKDKLPFRQHDWPIWRDHQRSPPSYTAFYNRNLIAKDKLPFSQQYWPLTPDNRRLSDWLQATNPNLFVPPPIFPPRTKHSMRLESLYHPDARPGAPQSIRSNVQNPNTTR